MVCKDFVQQNLDEGIRLQALKVSGIIDCQA